MHKEKLIFVYPKLFTFIQTEIKLLSDDYELIHQPRNWSSKFRLPLNLINQFFFLLLNIRKVHTILVSFGGYWSLLPTLFGKTFGKKVFIVVHGTDCVSFPEINYGNLRIPLMRYFTRKSYQWASIILPVSESLVFTCNTYYAEKALEFGYSHHLTNIKTPYKVIPNGLVIEDWIRDDEVKKVKNTFITVMTQDQLERKGAFLIVDAANHLPNCKFYFAGIDKIEKLDFPENVICLGHLTPQVLKQWYSKTQFYLQLSNFEGFGVSICEAMLCNCVPIVSDVNFLPTIVGNSGFILYKRDVSLFVDLVNTALKSDLKSLEIDAKERIIENFPINKRKEILFSILKN